MIIISYIIHQKEVLRMVCVYLCLKDAVRKCCPLSGVILLLTHAVGRPFLFLFLFRLHIVSLLSFSLSLYLPPIHNHKLYIYLHFNVFSRLFCVTYTHTQNQTYAHTAVLSVYLQAFVFELYDICDWMIYFKLFLYYIIKLIPAIYVNLNRFTHIFYTHGHFTIFAGRNYKQLIVNCIFMYIYV